MKARLEWINRLRTALDRGQFTLYAQPIRQLDDGTAENFELLLRMVDDQGEAIPPGSFLYPRRALRHDPGARRVGRQGGDRAAREPTARQPRRDQHQHLRQVAGQQQAVGDRATRAAREAGRAQPGSSSRSRRPPRSLRSQWRAISPNGCARSAAASRWTTSAPASAACSISSTSPSTTSRSTASSSSTASPTRPTNLGHRALVSLAHGLGKRTVAEGVENYETELFLRSQRVDLVQGYFVGRPIPVSDGPRSGR